MRLFCVCAVFTDEALFEACGVRIAFTMREGGVSEGPYASLNLGSHVQDDLDKVLQNRALLFSALAPSLEESEQALIVPKQVHGDTVLTVGAAREVARVQRAAAEGADGSSFPRMRWERSCALLIACRLSSCCLRAVSRRACSWRGIENEISAKALGLMLDQECQEHGFSRSELAAQTNVYIGPYIHRECFETGADVHAFSLRSSVRSAVSMRHISIWELPCAFSLLRAASTCAYLRSGLLYGM